jgi:chitinase
VDHVKTKSANKEAKIYMGLAAAPGATYGSMYLSPDEASQLVEKYFNKWPSMFGGVMLWEATFSEENQVDGMSYGKHMKKALESCAPTNPPYPTSSVVASSTMSSEVGPIGSSSAEHPMSSSDAYSTSSMDYSTASSEEYPASTSADYSASSSEHYPSASSETYSTSNMEYSTTSSEYYPTTTPDSYSTTTDDYSTEEPEEYPTSTSEEDYSTTSSEHYTTASSEQHPASTTAESSSSDTTASPSYQMTSSSSSPVSSSSTSYTNTIDGVSTSSTTSASPSASPSDCGVKGFDKSPAYNFLNDTATATFEKCSARCSADPVCVSFAFGLTQCLLYTQSV